MRAAPSRSPNASVTSCGCGHWRVRSPPPITRGARRSAFRSRPRRRRWPVADTRDLLIEIGTEELPPKALRRLAEAFAEGMRAGLAKHELPHGELRYYATPRRLAVLVYDVPAAQLDRVVERRGPALNAAFDEEGNPTKASLGFARSCTVAVDDLARLETEQGAWLVCRSVQQGMATRELIPTMVEQALAALPVPKRMRWGSLRAEFVRPVHWLVVLLGDFEARFLALPPEPLISTMKGNQKYFHLIDAAGKLLPHFITVCNIESRDPAQVRAGNERVIRPRFSDAAFFWEQDRRLTLEQRSENLKTVLFQAKLGSVYDNSQRVAALAGAIAAELGADRVLAERAARLAKCGLQ